MVHAWAHIHLLRMPSSAILQVGQFCFSIWVRTWQSCQQGEACFKVRHKHTHFAIVTIKPLTQGLRVGDLSIPRTEDGRCDTATLRPL